ncbi:unnamed protein product [Caenorhabditis angaria]|uniref:Diacylglycerol kinase n=1 Tax=Caenorhabditis angaria TaxID=860376 RepID=A0A9P1IHY7_9PELO|nr:unnamed protein product [Caenorhabditis angaria]
MLLSPDQFSRLSEYAAYSRRKLKDMLSDFQADGKFYAYLSNDGQTINFDGFRAFILDLFGTDLPSDLVDQLFLSFSKPPTKERRTSLFEDAIHTVKAKFSESLSGRMERLNLSSCPPSSSSGAQNSDRSGHQNGCGNEQLVCIPEDGTLTLVENSLHQGTFLFPDVVAISPPSPAHSSSSATNSTEPRIPLKPLICTLSLLEADTPENKLDVVFHIYDSDGNGYLDKSEIDGIIEQMMNVARYQQWDTIELEQIIRQMMVDIDYDNDGIVSFDEWRRGGLTNIPLLVLLGFDTEMKEDGSHVWKLRHFSKPTYCNACCSILVGWGGKQGLSCSLCKYTVHERCVRSASNNCIRTYSSRQQDKLYHHWQDANATAKCVKCRTTVGVFQGKGCRWCHNYVSLKRSALAVCVSLRL